jgi:hypothetical protein
MFRRGADRDGADPDRAFGYNQRVMAKVLLLLFGTLALGMMPSLAKGTCTEKDLQPGWLWNYDGTIGDKYRVRLTLTASQGEVSGVYFYATQMKDIRIAGRISDGHLALSEFDTSGGITARFEGEFPDHDPHGQFKGTLRCEVIVGSWQKEGAPEKLPFYLSQENGNSGTLDHRYAVAGARDDTLIHQNALRFWQAIVKGDKATVASLIDYPIKVQVAGTARSVRSRQELISQYDAIFSPAYRKAVADAIPRNMFARDQGIMLGSGEAWFDSNGRVIALNNY